MPNSQRPGTAETEPGHPMHTAAKRRWGSGSIAPEQGLRTRPGGRVTPQTGVAGSGCPTWQHLEPDHLSSNPSYPNCEVLSK